MSAGLLTLSACYEEDSAPDPQVMSQAQAASSQDDAQAAGEDEARAAAREAAIAKPGSAAVLEASASLSPASGSDVRGEVRFQEVDAGTRVIAEISGLEEGEHGFHIHENGDCSAADASSAGGHLAPHGRHHGAPAGDPGERHVGDLGNIEAEADGTAVYDRIDSVISLDGANAVLGKAVIVHRGKDDLTTQPSGDAGDRLACGVIRAASLADSDAG